MPSWNRCNRWLKNCIPLAGGEHVLQVHSKYLPLVELYNVFDVKEAKTEATQAIIVIFAKVQAILATPCWLNDGGIGQHQVVVKKTSKVSLSQSAWHFRRHHFGRRQCGSDRGCVCLAVAEPRQTRKSGVYCRITSNASGDRNVAGCENFRPIKR